MERLRSIKAAATLLYNEIIKLEESLCPFNFDGCGVEVEHIVNEGSDRPKLILIHGGKLTSDSED